MARRRSPQGIETRLIEQIDLAGELQRQCSALELLARAVIENGPAEVLGRLTPGARAQFAEMGAPVSDPAALRAWARKTWTAFLRTAAEINFLCKIGDAAKSIQAKDLPAYSGVMGYVVPKPRQDVGITGADGGPVEVRNLTDGELDSKLSQLLGKAGVDSAPGGTGEAEE